MYLTRTLSVNIACAPSDVYEFVANPENLPHWAGGFCRSVECTAAGWEVQTVTGSMLFRFAESNAFGVLDHYVTPVQGDEVFVPMRVIPNGNGCTLLFTLFQLPGMSDIDFGRDVRLVERDLSGLKILLED